MNLKELKEMISLMQENDLSELEIEKNGFKVRLKKGASGTIVQEVSARPVAQVAVEAASGVSAGKKPEEDEGLAPGVVLVKSPMVGTFYIAPAPDAAPYVAKDKEVGEGDVLCIIEAMKLMNEIKNEVRGRVLDILVQNGQPVEFDQPLFKIQQS